MKTVVAWGGIEPPTRGFSMGIRAFGENEPTRKTIVNQRLARCQAQSRAARRRRSQLRMTEMAPEKKDPLRGLERGLSEGDREQRSRLDSRPV